jgi:hypothetical protein
MEKTSISRHILHRHWYTCPIALPFRRNPQHASFWLLSQPLPHLRFIICDFRTFLREFFDPVVNRFTRQTLPTINRKHFLWTSFALSPFVHKKKTHNRTLLFVSILKHRRHFNYWNQPLNMRMRVFYLDCHEAGLCCYLVIHIGVHCSCFTSIYALFTDSPSYVHDFSRKSWREETTRESIRTWKDNTMDHNKQEVMMLIGFIWLKRGTSVSLL